VVSAIVVHANYLINLASSDETLFSKSRTLLLQTLTSASNLGCGSVVLHIGSHRGAGYEAVREQVIAVLTEASVLLDAHVTPTKLLLENTAGAGGTVGGSLEELGDLIVGVGRPDRLGVCLDTQHLFAFGYDLRDRYVREDVAASARDLFGGVDAVHCNDSKTECGSNHDRHANLGEGAIGEAAISEFLSLDAFAATDIILEVPGDGDGPRPEDVIQLRGLLGLPHPH
jgi:deoxyribonuclease-4